MQFKNRKVKTPMKNFQLVMKNGKNMVENVPVEAYDANRAKSVYEDMFLLKGQTLVGVRGERGRFVA